MTLRLVDVAAAHDLLSVHDVSLAVDPVANVLRLPLSPPHISPLAFRPASPANTFTQLQLHAQPTLHRFQPSQHIVTQRTIMSLTNFFYEPFYSLSDFDRLFDDAFNARQGSPRGQSAQNGQNGQLARRGSTLSGLRPK